MGATERQPFALCIERPQISRVLTGRMDGPHASARGGAQLDVRRAAGGHVTKLQAIASRKRTIGRSALVGRFGFASASVARPASGLGDRIREEKGS